MLVNIWPMVRTYSEHRFLEDIQNLLFCDWLIQIICFCSSNNDWIDINFNQWWEFGMQWYWTVADLLIDPILEENRTTSEKKINKINKIISLFYHLSFILLNFFLIILVIHYIFILFIYCGYMGTSFPQVLSIEHPPN